MPLDIRIRFGRAIRRIREEQKINQEEAAERCGLPTSEHCPPLGRAEDPLLVWYILTCIRVRGNSFS
jgi:transcriptional regulator with XRE-family HTH domain